MPNRYRLKIDVDYVKAGAESRSNNEDHYYFENNFGKMVWFPASFVQNYSQLFELIKEEPAKEAFQWNDNLVATIVSDAHRDGFHKEPLGIYDRIEQFKQSLNPSLHERIEPDEFLFRDGTFDIFKPKTKNNVVNVGTANGQFWIGEEKDGTTTISMYDHFFIKIYGSHKNNPTIVIDSNEWETRLVIKETERHWRDIVNHTSKKFFTQQQMDKAIEESWVAARLCHPLAGMKFDTFDDYITHLKSIKVK